MRAARLLPALLLTALMAASACQRTAPPGAHDGAQESAETSSPVLAAPSMPEAAGDAAAGDPAAGDPATGMAREAEALPTDTALRSGRMLLRTGEMAVRVPHLRRARTDALAAVTQLGGYVDAETETNGSHGAEATLTLRVPARRFDSLAARLSDLGTVERRSMQVEDATRAYADLDARMRTRLATEQRYRELLARAQTVEEVMAVERQLGELRGEIESTEAQLRVLRSQAAHSTLVLVLTTHASGAPGPSFLARLADALRDGATLLGELLLAGVRLWGVWLLLALGGLAWRRWIGPWRARRRATPPAP